MFSHICYASFLHASSLFSLAYKSIVLTTLYQVQRRNRVIRSVVDCDYPRRARDSPSLRAHHLFLSLLPCRISLNLSVEFRERRVSYTRGIPEHK